MDLKMKIFNNIVGRHLAISVLSVSLFSLYSCENNEEPHKLSFQDIYGRESWTVESDYPSGYFYIERSKDINVEELSDSPETGKQYKLTLEGADPSFSSQRILTQLNGMVLSFLYTSTDVLQMSISMDNTDKIVNSKLFELKATQTPTEYSFDLGMLLEMGNWGGVASSFTISFQQKDGAVVTIDRLQIRQRNQAEINAATNVFYLDGFYGEKNTVITYETDIYTYGMTTFRYHPTNNEWNNNVAQSDMITQNVPKSYSKFSFEYKAESSFTMWFFYVLNEDGRMTITPDASSEWKKVTIDMNAAPEDGGPDNGASGRFDNIWAGGDPTVPRRFRIDISAGGKDVMLRGVSLHE